MSGMSRREIIKRSAVAGAAAWTAPVVYSSLTSAAGAVDTLPPVCTGVKIPSHSNNSISSGNVALCNEFATDKLPDLACFVTLVTAYSPQDGFLLQLCGPTATNLRGIAVKMAGNNGCSSLPPEAVDEGGALCIPFSNDPTYPTTAVHQGPYVCANSGNIIELGQIGQPLTAPGAPAAALIAPASGCRWLWIHTGDGGANLGPNINEIGLQICFPGSSVPPSCPKN